MCGIAGFYGFRDDRLIHKFSKLLAHRGPDGEGFFINDQVTLLNRRLAIIDRAGGDQPIYNEDKSIVVTYNGEIYNYHELRKILEKYGHKFKTISDTEVIIHGYEQWGADYFDRMNGMFALALWDIKKEKLILARDHFGIKPLYYSLLNNPNSTIKLIFSSEIKPIFNSGLIKKTPNDKIIFRYLKFRIHDDTKETFFDNILRLMPGEYLEIQNSKIKIKKFTEIQENLLKSKPSEVLTDLDVDHFSDNVIKAIKYRLISEVPVGSCLSGGLDSSTIVTIINKLLKEKSKASLSVGKNQNTFSAVFPKGSNDEEKYIDKVIDSLNIISHKIRPTPENFFKEIKDFITTQEEPTISTGPYAQYKVMQTVQKFVTVVLDGQGADEMMAGYLPYYFVYLRQLIRQKKYLKFLKEFILSLDVIIKILNIRFYEMIGLKKKISVNTLLNQNYSNKYKNEKYTLTTDNLKKRLIDDIFFNSLQPLLRYEDRNSMKFSVEGRVPFLDFNLIKLLFSLPDEAIIKNGINKYILKKSFEDLVPKLILKRRNKIGFTTPEYQWFMRMKNKIYQIFLSESFTKRKYFNQPEVLKAYQLFIEGKVDDTMVFWRLLNLEIWLRIFFDPNLSRSLGLQKTKSQYYPNEGKRLEIIIGKKKYLRYPIKTNLFKKGDNVVNKISESLLHYINIMEWKKEASILFKTKKWFLVVSEKIVAIAQGRSYFIWDLKPGIWAKILYRFVTKTPFGIGLGSPQTMQLAIDEAGLNKILLATIISAMTKPLGIKGLFYKIAGQNIAAIDGPTEYSLYPSNVSAKLGPKDPQYVAEKIKSQIINNKLKLNFKFQISNFLGAVIIDANDLGQKVLGNSTNLKNDLIEKIFSDNPMGQADEQTPLVITVLNNENTR